MRIESSDLALRSQHRFQRVEVEQTRLVADPPAAPRPTTVPSGSGGALAPGLQQAAGEPALDPENSLRIGVLKALFKRLLGMDFDIKTLHDLQAPHATPPSRPMDAPQGGDSGRGFRLEFSSIRLEREALQVQAAGRVVTADGRTIDLEVQLNMSRTLYTHVQGRLGESAETRDPLMLSLDGTAPALSSARFEFDLDSDGASEAIPVPQAGTAFLARDGNADGRINDGRELFGARSGDGFRDLAEHDQDGNGWIDAADPVFRELRVWQVDSEGGGTLVALGEVGIGAIYLGNVASPFEIRDGREALQGLLRESGIYLREDGTAGTLHQVDLVV